MRSHRTSVLHSTEHATGGHTRRRSHHRSSASPHVANAPNESRPQRNFSSTAPRELSAPVEVAATDDGDERLGVLLLGPLELTGCKKKQPRRQATAELIAYLAVQRRR